MSKPGGYDIYRVADPPRARLVWARSRKEAIRKAIVPHRTIYFSTHDVLKLRLAYQLVGANQGQKQKLVHYLQKPSIVQIEADLAALTDCLHTSSLELRYLWYSKAKTAYEGGVLAYIKWDGESKTVTDSMPVFEPPPRTRIEARRSLQADSEPGDWAFTFSPTSATPT